MNSFELKLSLLLGASLIPRLYRLNDGTETKRRNKHETEEAVASLLISRVGGAYCA